MISFKTFLIEDTGLAHSFLTKKKHDELRDHYNSIPDYRYTDEHKRNTDEKSLYKYTYNSRKINSSLWKIHNKQELDSDEKEQHDTHVPVLDKILQKHTAPKGGVDVYSGMKSDPRKSMNSNGIVHHPAYLSTSISKTVASRFTNSVSDVSHIIHIHVPEGHHGAYIAHASAGMSEREFLLPRGLNLKHLKTTYDGGGQLTHHMQILPEKS